jgi:hypothetical protein
VTLTTLAFVAVTALLLWEYERTNYGSVILRSTASGITIEAVRDGRVEQTYDASRGGPLWQLPVGTWQFRIQGGRDDYRLDQTNVYIPRGTTIRVQVLPTDTAAPIVSPIVDTTAWDKLIVIAEQAYENVNAKNSAGLESNAAMHQAHGGLIEAKVQRARATHQRDEVIALLKELISVREQQLASIEVLYRSGKTTQLDLQTVLKSLVETQAALEEAESEQ